MKLDEIKKLPGTRANIKRLVELVEEKKLSQSQYWEIRSEWSKKDREYSKALGGSLSGDTEAVKGDNVSEVIKEFGND